MLWLMNFLKSIILFTIMCCYEWQDDILMDAGECLNIYFFFSEKCRAGKGEKQFSINK